MRIPLLMLSLIGIVAATASSHAQGLLALRNPTDFKDDLPMTYSVGVQGGFDLLNYKNNSNGLSDIDSFFIEGTVGATYSDNDPTTPWNVGADFGVIHYLDDAPRYDDTYYSARVAFNIAHQASRRLRLQNNFFLTYEVEPDYSVGASTSLRNGQYLYGYNNFSLSYAWSERFSTVTSYTIDGIQYQDDLVSSFEDRLSHIIAQQFVYAITRNTKLVTEYRFRLTNYANLSDADYTSHYVLAGVDHAWSERTTGSVRAGAEFYNSDRVSDVAPYAEASLNYELGRLTDLQWYHALGFDASEIGSYDSRYSYRTGLTVAHQFSDRLTVNAGAHYVYSEYDGGDTQPGVTEQEVHASAGLAYRLWQNVSMDAEYSYTLLTSDDDFRDYDRNRVSLGLSASF